MITNTAPTPTSPEGIPEDETPPCFQDGYDFGYWNYWNRISRELKAPSYCFDCTPEYKARMVELDRCVHPETKFYEFVGPLQEPEIVGLRKPPSPWQRRFCRGEVPPV